MLSVSDISVIPAGFSGSPSTSGIRHPNLFLNLSDGVDNSVSPAALAWALTEKLPAFAPQTLAELAVIGSSSVLYSFFQM